MSEEQPMTDAQIRAGSRRQLTVLSELTVTLQIINTNHNLCKDGVRAVNHIVTATESLINEIYADDDGDVAEIADRLQKAVAGINQK